jgi:hypothetical protein
VLGAQERPSKRLISRMPVAASVKWTVAMPSSSATGRFAVEDAVQLVARVRVELALAPRVRQQANSDTSFTGVLDQVQDLGPRTQAAKCAG